MFTPAIEAMLKAIHVAKISHRCMNNELDISVDLHNSIRHNKEVRDEIEKEIRSLSTMSHLDPVFLNRILILVMAEMPFEVEQAINQRIIDYLKDIKEPSA